MKLRGQKYWTVQLEDKPIASGGEGDIYQVKTHRINNLVAKIYRDRNKAIKMKNKILTGEFKISEPVERINL